MNFLPEPAWLNGQEGSRKAPPRVMTIAGSDSGGGAGIQADLKTFQALGVYASSVITALTAQNGLGVNGIYSVTPEFVALQLKTVLEGFPITAAKTGMLFSAEIIDAVVDVLEAQKIRLLVDPVCISQSGHKLMQDSAIHTLKKRLLPLAEIITPNVPEAEFITGIKISSARSLEDACAKMLDMGAGAVLLKGGHLPPDYDFGKDGPFSKDAVVDFLAFLEASPKMGTGVGPKMGPEDSAGKQIKILLLPHRRVTTTNNHGTGCTLGAAITAFLGHGLGLQESVQKAQQYLNMALQYAYNPGKGCGPVNHAIGAIGAIGAIEGR